MDTDYNNAIDTNDQKPQVFLKYITFNDGTKLPLEHNSIVVFTGPNNSGKSQSLRDIELNLNQTNNAPPIVIKETECEFLGSIENPTFLKEHFFVDKGGHYRFIESNLLFDMPLLHLYWKNHTLKNTFHQLFVRLLSTELRLTSSNPLNRHQAPQIHPIYRLNKSEELSQKLSDYFRQAFGVDLVLNRNDMQTIPLHIGDSPDKNSFTIAQHDEYYDQVSALPMLQHQGDGMRSFASILLDAFTSDHTITLIDEPEAFLHPPQARILGKMLATNNSSERQLFISTHSEDFLQGLIDANNENITVIRLNRENDINKISILEKNEIKKLWGNPLLRYSNILSGLFHEKVVVCESDYDCLFYQAIMDAMYEHKGQVAPDILFTHCGGKTRVKDVANALKAVNVPVVAVCDFDLLNASQNFKPLAVALGIDWDNALSVNMKTIYDSMNAKNNAWDQIKEIGKSGFTGNEPAAYEEVEAVCKSAGLFVVPVGEMECFDKTVNEKKKDWVYYVLENYNLADEPKLEEARRFVYAVANYPSGSMS